MKTRSGQAIKLSTSRVELPEGEEFRTAVDRFRQDPTLGNRLSQAEYVADIASRDREWLGSGEGAEAVTGFKQRRIVKLALDYVTRNRLHDCPCRFDVVSIDLDGGRTVIEVFQNAFHA